jgi:hypothetical protein
MRKSPPPPQDGGFWYALWTFSKFALALAIVLPICVFMLASSQPTVTPMASVAATAVIPLASPTPGPTPTSGPTPVHPLDAVVPGHLYYVQGRVIYDLHGYDAPRYVVAGADPSISADGSLLAYLLFYKNWDNIYVMNRKTGHATLVLNNSPTDPTDVRTGMSAGAPSFSADNSTLYFSWSYPGAANPTAPGYYDRLDLSVTACALSGLCNTSTARQLSQPSFESGGDDEPTVRPLDPSTLVFTSYNYVTLNGIPSTYGRLEALNPQTGAFLGFISPPIPSLLNPAWSPNGRYLAFVERSSDYQQSSIYVMTYHPNALGSQVNQYDQQDFDHAHLLVKGAPFAIHPVFSPDGKYMAYEASASDGRLHLYIAQVHLGPHPHLDHVQEVQRVGIVDGDRLAWTT